MSTKKHIDVPVWRFSFHFSASCFQSLFFSTKKGSCDACELMSDLAPNAAPKPRAFPYALASQLARSCMGLKSQVAFCSFAQFDTKIAPANQAPQVHLQVARSHVLSKTYEDMNLRDQNMRRCVCVGRPAQPPKATTRNFKPEF